MRTVRPVAIVAAVALLALVGMSSSARAAVELFDFGTLPVGDQGSNSASVSSGPYTIFIAGYDSPTNAPHNLYDKHDGGNEQGVGLTDTTSHELTLTRNDTDTGNVIANYIQFDVGQFYLITTNPLAKVGSTTNGEQWDIYGSNVAGSIGTLILSGQNADATFVSIPDWGAYRYISIATTPQGTALDHSHDADNVLPMQIEVTESAVPLPASAWAGMTGLGLAAAVLIRRRSGLTA